MISRGTCQRVAGALKITPRLAANPESAGSANVININIKTSNESLAIPQRTYLCVPYNPLTARLESRRRDLPVASAPPALIFSSDQFHV
jgi:hypothetical protein